MDRNRFDAGVELSTPVALRKESVDRNRRDLVKPRLRPQSLSARRAWIEMFSVREVFANFDGRSPQGERG